MIKQKNNKQAGFTPAIMLLAIFLILVAGGGAFWYSQNATVLPDDLEQDSSGQVASQQEVDGVTGRAQVYRNEDFAAFNYRKGWVVVEDMSAIPHLVLRSPDYKLHEGLLSDGYEIVVIQQGFNSSFIGQIDLMKQSVLDDFKRYNKNNIRNMREVFVKKGAGIVFEPHPLDNPDEKFNIIKALVFGESGHAYDITISSVNKKTDEGGEEIRAIFNEFLSSFEALKVFSFGFIILSDMSDRPNIFQKNFYGDAQDWNNRAIDVTDAEIKEIKFLTSLNGVPDTLSFYYAEKDKVAEVKLIGELSSDDFSDTYQGSVVWANFPKKELYVWVEAEKDGKKFVSDKEKVFFSSN